MGSRSAGPGVRPLAAGRSPTDEFWGSASVAFHVHVGGLPLHDGEHAADQFEFDGVHDAAVRFPLGPLAFVVGFEIGVMVDGAAGALCQYALDLVMTGVADMVSAPDRSA